MTKVPDDNKDGFVKPMGRHTGKKPGGKRATSKRGNHAIVPPKRGGGAKPIAALLPQVGAIAFRKFGFIQTALVSRWRDIVGVSIADITQPAMIRFPPRTKVGGSLYVTIASAHAPLIQHRAQEIITAVNRFFGYQAVAQIRLSHAAGVSPVSPASPTSPVSQQLSAHLSGPTSAEAGTGWRGTPPIQPHESTELSAQLLGDSLCTIADEELCVILERMAVRLTQSSASLPRIR